MPTQRICGTAGDHQRRRDECAVRELFDRTRAKPAALDAQASNDHYRTPGLGLLPDGQGSSDTEMIPGPFIRAAYSHIHESTTGEIEARLAIAHDGVPYFTEVPPIDDNFFSLSVDVDVPASRNRMLHLTCDRQFATSWDAQSFVARVMVTMQSSGA